MFTLIFSILLLSSVVCGYGPALPVTVSRSSSSLSQSLSAPIQCDSDLEVLNLKLVSVSLGKVTQSQL